MADKKIMKSHLIFDICKVVSHLEIMIRPLTKFNFLKKHKFLQLIQCSETTVLHFQIRHLIPGKSNCTKIHVQLQK